MTAPQFASAQSSRRSWLLPILALTLAAALWALSLALPVWDARSHNGQVTAVPGILPAFIGWLGILVFCPAWYANPLLLPLGFTLFKARRFGFWLGVCAFALAASAYFMRAIYGDDEPAQLVARKIGFYVWLASFLVILVAHALQLPPASSPSPRTRWTIFSLLLLIIIILEFTVRLG